jgi:hypothetical protein
MIIVLEILLVVLACAILSGAIIFVIQFILNLWDRR